MASEACELYGKTKHHFGVAESLLSLVKADAYPGASYAMQPLLLPQHVDIAVRTVEKLFEMVRSFSTTTVASSTIVLQLQREADAWFGISTLRRDATQRQVDCAENPRFVAQLRADPSVKLRELSPVAVSLAAADVKRCAARSTWSMACDLLLAIIKEVNSAHDRACRPATITDLTHSEHPNPG